MTAKKHKHHHDWGGKKDDRMAYEKGTPMNFAVGGSAFAEGWERIFGKKARQPDEVLCGKPLPAEGGVFPCRRPAGHPDGEHGL